jgi:2-hydroxy-3-keto-5-methylthiopentenyl-1-phosphate phosphatase
MDISQQAKTPEKIALIFDFDLTCTEEYQQCVLIKKYLNKYQEIYNQPEKIKSVQQYVPEYEGIYKIGDFFKLVDANIKEAQSKINDIRVQRGVTWISQLCKDMQQGGPLYGCTNEEFIELGKSIELSPGIRQFFTEIKATWATQNVEVKIYIISVGLKPFIEGAIGGLVDGIFAGEIYNGQIMSIIEDYTKTEIAFEIAKGGQDKKNIKLRGDEYDIPYNKFVVIGDGYTDIPNWRFYRKYGAPCVMVYKAGSMMEYEKAMKIAHQEADYVLERDYTPNPRNPTWRYLNDAIQTIVNRKCNHSEYSLHMYRWSKRLSKTEENEIEQHYMVCKEHEPGLRLTHVVPKSKIWRGKNDDDDTHDQVE